jgi:glutaredoxin
MRASLLLFSLLCAGLVQAQGAYRWVDQDGKVHYGDRPPPALAGKAREFKTGTPEAEKQLPYATRQAMEKFPVALYVSADCGEGCKEATAYLRKRGVPFSEKRVASNEEISDLQQLLGGGEVVVPVLVVGTKTRKGFEQGSWDGLLDAAGYPKAKASD